MSDYVAGQVLTADDLNESFSENTQNAAAAITGGWVKGVDYVYVTGAENPTSPAQGSLRTAGGLGVLLDAWIGGQVNANGAIYARATDESTSSTTGALVVSGGASIAKTLRVGLGITAGGTISASHGTFSNTDDATSTTTGAIHTQGGISAIKSAFIGGSATVVGGLTVQQGVSVSGALTAAGLSLSSGSAVTFPDGTKQSTASTAVTQNPTFQTVTATSGATVGGPLQVNSYVTATNGYFGSRADLDGGMAIGKLDTSSTTLAIGNSEVSFSQIDMASGASNPGSGAAYGVRMQANSGNGATAGSAKLTIYSSGVIIDSAGLEAWGNIQSDNGDVISAAGYLRGQGAVLGAGGVTIQATGGGVTFPDGTKQTTAVAPLPTDPEYNTVTVDKALTAGSITSKGDIVINESTGTAQLVVSNAGGGVNAVLSSSTQSQFQFMRNSVNRWVVGTQVDESGTDLAGSDFGIRRFSNSGVDEGNAFYISRADGRVYMDAAQINASLIAYSGVTFGDGTVQTSASQVSNSTDYIYTTASGSILVGDTTITNSAFAAGIIKVVDNGSEYTEGQEYTKSGSTLTFANPMLANTEIVVSVTTASVVSGMLPLTGGAISGDLSVSGGLSVAGSMKRSGNTVLDTSNGISLLKVGLVELAKVSIAKGSEVTEIDLPSVFTADYDHYEISFRGVATNGSQSTSAAGYANFGIQFTKDGSNYDTSNYVQQNTYTYYQGTTYSTNGSSAPCSYIGSIIGGSVGNDGVRFYECNGDATITLGKYNQNKVISEVITVGNASAPAVLFQRWMTIQQSSAPLARPVGMRIIANGLQNSATGISGDFVVYGKRTVSLS